MRVFHSTDLALLSILLVCRLSCSNKYCNPNYWSLSWVLFNITLKHGDFVCTALIKSVPAAKLLVFLTCLSCLCKTITLMELGGNEAKQHTLQVILFLSVFTTVSRFSRIIPSQFLPCLLCLNNFHAIYFIIGLVSKSSKNSINEGQGRKSLEKGNVRMTEIMILKTSI